MGGRPGCSLLTSERRMALRGLAACAELLSASRRRTSLSETVNIAVDIADPSVSA